ncbi:putative cytosol aminopeptidase [Pullulanibacillus camelliae]|uniref:Probable cytosol aminopeptidase n=1 Tax=Pullulanibacillus camelliae TaxID=1707096 RepID=A0A8J2VJV1_9BACL|nr:leucyl aminopeptidase family protein [Pullulanibacillus camelliae]GGE27410.1 putative cytosol aminopeptidase [Pullulanibacillus camelliae]
MEQAYIHFISYNSVEELKLLKNKKLFQYPKITLVYDRKYLPILYVGVEKEHLVLDDIRNLSGEVAKFMKEKGFTEGISQISELTSFFQRWDQAKVLMAFYEGWYLGQYSFNKYKKVKEDGRIELIVEGDDNDYYKNIALIRSNAVMHVRDLCNEPPNVLYPESYERMVRTFFSDNDKVEITVYNQEDLIERELNGLLAVSRGSAHSPKVIKLSYKTSETAPHIALIGKGVTFDSGGVNIKSGDFSDMKMDMGGSAAVVGAIHLLSHMHAEAHVTAIIPIVENLTDSRSLLPSEIIHYKNDTTVQVVNTDGEGRLILADSLLLAQELGAETIVDIATLTGSVGHALGLKVAGLWSNTETVALKLKEIGEENGDLIWPMPLVSEYKEWLENPYADISNVGTNAYGGAITAAVFLSHFVEPGIKWAHIDMANTVQSWKTFGYYTSGASGFGARLLADFVIGEK